MKATKSALILVLLLTLLLAPAGAGRAEDWTPIPIPPDATMGRFGYSMVEFPNGWELLPGGEEEGADLSTVNSAPGADEWQQLLPTTSPSPRFGHTMVTIENTVYLFGGVNYSSSEQLLNVHSPSEQLFNDIWAWNNAEAEWLEIPQVAPPPARHSHAAVALGSKMYVLFGQDGSGNFFEDENGTISSELWKYDPSTNRWEQKAALPAGGIREHAAAGVAGKMYVFFGEDGENPLDDLWVYVPTGDSWTQLSPANAPSARHGIGVAQSGALVWLIGGSSPGSNLRETWEFNVTAQTWTKRTDCPISLYLPALSSLTSTSMARAGEPSSSQAQLNVLVFGGINGTATVNPTLKYLPDLQSVLNYKVYLPMLMRTASALTATGEQP
jgi:N-acetylneuraminic acid mutarotase